MTRVKSLLQNKSKEYYEKFPIPAHRTHRSKKNRTPYTTSLSCKVFKDKLQRLKEEELLLDNLIKL
jgi:hypothetical protein